MKQRPHNAKRAAFWLLLASVFIIGLLLFFVPSHKISGGLALGVVAILVLKHIGLLMIFGSPTIGALKIANKRAKGLLRQYVCKIT